MLQKRFKLDTARRDFESVYNRARLGDMEAIEEIENVSLRLLESSISFYGRKSEQYQNEFDNVQRALLNVEDVATRQASIAGLKLDQTESEIQELKELLDS